ncbi:COMM domain-containing protein 9-like isoform X2 [Babylonia areolata]|uniref:COMM domain-containing protein 9-like isoform X2 n=1 Tax=Babylonia areolata TaxID=304850 RepID=UPI003FD3FA0E
MTCDFGSLECLLKASSKTEVVKVCRDVFSAVNRNSIQIPDSLLSHCQQTLKLTQTQAEIFVKSLGSILKQAVFQGSTDPHDIVALFPDGFHKNLRDLIGKIIIDNMADWKSQAVGAHVSLPKLADFDWRVDVKTASDTVARMSVPTCVLSLQVESGEEDDQTRGQQTVNVELSKETLDTMLDGLSKIRDQLLSVANR